MSPYCWVYPQCTVDFTCTRSLLDIETWKVPAIFRSHAPTFFEQTALSYVSCLKGCFVPSLVENRPMVLEKKILKCLKSFLLLPPLERRCGCSFEQTEIPFTQERFCKVLVEIRALKPKHPWMKNFNNHWPNFNMIGWRGGGG